MSRLVVSIIDAGGSTNVPTEAQFDQWTKALSQQLDHTGNICVRIVSSEEMEQLNSQFRGKQGLTNVLSFEADHSDIPMQVLNGNDDLRDFLGDVAICADVVAAESRAQNKLIEAHWAHLFVHGVLHLCGYDHMEDSEATLMEGLETQILLAMGYAAPYGNNNEIKTRVS
ncbi:MAG: rRNA maturation RNase YbeY [Pseudomonadales bacterium]